MTILVHGRDFSLTALYAYEYIVTFDCEVELFWRRKFTVSSALFFLNRYLPFVVCIMNMPYPDPLTYIVSYLLSVIVYISVY